MTRSRFLSNEPRVRTPKIAAHPSFLKVSFGHEAEVAKLKLKASFLDSCRSKFMD
jgi:hypothetical protein